MKRVVYAIPFLFLLPPWMFISMVILGVGLTSNPFSLLLLLPMSAVLVSAFYVYDQRTKCGQHGVAALGASAILAAPLVAIVVAFFSGGEDLARSQFTVPRHLDAPATDTRNGLPSDPECRF